MNSLGICHVKMVLTHPFLHHWRGKARWHLALFVMKKDQAEAKILHSSFPGKKKKKSGLLFSTYLSLPHDPKEHIPFSMRSWSLRKETELFEDDASFLACQKGSFSPPCLLCSSMVRTQSPHGALHCANHLHKAGNGGCNKLCSSHQLQHWRGKNFHTAVAFCCQSHGAEIQLSN